jgi:DNA-binding MltR family transcriptional regulator
MTQEKQIEKAQQVAKFVVRLANESERSAVILGAAKIDNLLEVYLKSIMANHPTGSDNLFDPERPLSTFSAKTTLAYRLGAISQDFEVALKHIRKIRNDFAHNIETESLTEQSHKDRIQELLRLVSQDELFNYISPVLRKEIKSNNLVEFCSVVGVIYADLELGINHSKKYKGGWCIDFKINDLPA